jgi:hypothetical protein
MGTRGPFIPPARPKVEGDEVYIQPVVKSRPPMGDFDEDGGYLNEK